MPNETLASDAMRRHLVFATHKETQNCVALLNITVKYSLLSIKYKFINFNINDIFKIHGYDFAKVFIFLMATFKSCSSSRQRCIEEKTEDERKKRLHY